jgi:uncharacterized protein (TIGR00369 family)
MQATPPNPQDTLAQWLAEESELKSRADVGIGVTAPDRVAGMTGLQLMRGLLDGSLPRASIGKTLDFLPVVVEEGRVIFQGAPGPGHLNPLGSVHGGWFATLLDSALGCAVHSALPAGKAYTTLELKVNMIRALSPKVQRVRAIGQVIHVGGQTATAEARLVGPDGKLYAHATTTCLIFPLRPPPVTSAP